MRQPEPIYEGLAQRQQETVIEIIQGGQTEGKVVEVGLSALISADHLLRRFDWESDLPQPLACTEGCDYCCFNQVEVTPPEALVIGHFVERHFSPEDQERLLAKVAEALAIKAGKSKREIAGIRRELPCPFLQNRRCLIYQARPLVCRGMHSLNATQCEASLQAGDLSTDTHYPQRQALVRAIARGLLGGCRRLGCQSGALDLAQALEDYFSHLDPLLGWIRGLKVFSL